MCHLGSTQSYSLIQLDLSPGQPENNVHMIRQRNSTITSESLIVAATTKAPPHVFEHQEKISLLDFKPWEV